MAGRRSATTEPKQIQLQAVQGLRCQQRYKMLQAFGQLRQSLLGLAQHPSFATTIGLPRKRSIGPAGSGADATDVQRGHCAACGIKPGLRRVALVQPGNIGRYTGIAAAGINHQPLFLALLSLQAIKLVIGRAIKKDTDPQHSSCVACIAHQSCPRLFRLRAKMPRQI